MAAALNKSRRRDTGIVIIAIFFVVIFTKNCVEKNSLLNSFLDFVGYFLISAAAMGRVYCTAFLGGFKNNKIIDYGPFSTSRNPLYFCSFVGVVGISVLSNHLVLMAFAPLAFLWIYFSLIKREEVYLEEKFGKNYLDYKKRVPKFFPKFSLYSAPKTVEMAPKNLWNAMKDSIMWFLVFPLFQIIEYAHSAGYIKPLFYLP